MRTRNVSPRTLAGCLKPAAATARWLLPAALTSALFGCPNQELAPLAPCTVSGVSLEVPQSGVDKVDILFMIDNSGSMSEEQGKLSAVLPDMVNVLTTGFNDGKVKPGVKPDFPPVQSLHIGVVSSDMGVEGAPAQKSCGGLSFRPDEKNTATTTTFLNKPLGDDGVMNTSVAVALAGIWAPPTPGADPVEKVPADPTCADVTFPAGQRFIDFTAGMTNPADTAHKFGCIAKLGRNGCGLEQHLESILKSLTPPDSMVKFTATASGGKTPSSGNGTAINMNNPSGPNAKFLREDAILAVVMIADEDDCSLPDQYAPAMFDATSNALPGEINVRCGLAENQKYTYPVKERFVAGLKALKPTAYQDRLIVAGAVGMPVAANLGNLSTNGVVTGATNIDAILAREDMKFKVQRNQAGTADEPVPTCISDKGDGSAAPARRQLELIKNFGENGVATSICSNEYGSLLKVIVDKIAAQLTGACLPRKLNPDAMGAVNCDVVEIKAAGSPTGCDPAKGRDQQLANRTINGQSRTVCHMKQVPGGVGGEGWYYDDKSKEVQEQCRKNPQRIAFTGMANPDPGAQAKFECFQPVASGVDENDKGREAINLSCKEDPLNASAASGDSKCNSRAVNGAPLICVSGTCQLSCNRDSECPDGWVCNPDPGDNSRGFCINPTCPPSAQ